MPSQPRRAAEERGADKNFAKAVEIGYCNLLPAEVFSIKHEEASLLGITDTACARTVAGTQWLQAYSGRLAALGSRPELRKECEAYRFGTGKVYYYVVLAFELGGKVVQVRTSIINGDVPLLLSKTVLGKLGMVFDIERGQADFNRVGLKGFDLLVTSSGHPAIPIVPTKMDGDPGTFQAEDLKLAPKRQYTFAVACGSGYSKGPDMYNFFYDKKLDPGIKAMLVQEKLSQEEFIGWWSSAAITSDFWLERDHAWVRIHITPRKNLFNPSTWKTRATVQKEMLVQTAAEIRVTDGVCCGRTWIGKRQAPSSLSRVSCDHGTGPTQASSRQPHEQDPAAGGGDAVGSAGAPYLERDRDQGVHHGGPRSRESQRPHGADEEGVPHEPERAPREGKRVEDRLCQPRDQGQSHPLDKGLDQYSCPRAHEDRKIQGVPVLRDPGLLWPVGGEGADHSGQPRPGTCEIRAMVQQQAEEPGDQGLPREGCGTSVSRLNGSDPAINEPTVHNHDKGVMGHGKQQGQRFFDDRDEVENTPGHGPEGGAGDSRAGDEAGSAERQGQGDGQEVSTGIVHGQDGGPGRGRASRSPQRVNGRRRRAPRQ